MTHHELIDWARKMGLEVEILTFFDNNIRAHVYEAAFSIPNGDRISKLRFDYGMDGNQYADAMSKPYNDLKQFESWR